MNEVKPPSDLLDLGEFSNCMDFITRDGTPLLNVVTPAFDYVPPYLVRLFITDTVLLGLTMLMIWLLNTRHLKNKAAQDMLLCLHYEGLVLFSGVICSLHWTSGNQHKHGRCNWTDDNDISVCVD